MNKFENGLKKLAIWLEPNVDTDQIIPSDFLKVTSKEGLEFFEAHKAADVIHRKECEKLLDALTEEEKVKAEKASMLTARYLWNFLSGMSTKHKIQAAA